MGISPWACYLGALLLLLVPLPWLLAAAAAAAFHELCHWAAVKLLGGQVTALHLGAAGAKMEAVLEGRGRQLAAILAGPAGSLALVALCRWMPRLCLCAGIQGLFNLLPLRPLDGGRALELAVLAWCPRHGAVILTAVEWTVRLAMLLGVLALWGVEGLALAAVGLCLGALGKNPCKRRRFRVQ